MSHYTTLKTKLVETDAVVRALADVGFADVEVHDVATALYGFQGDVRPETAEVIVRRKHIGSSSNDIGFRRTDDGTYEAIISGADRSRYSEEWLNRLTQRYAYHATMSKLTSQGFAVASEETAEDGSVRLVLRRMV